MANCTSKLKAEAQVPIHHAINGFVIRPDVMASQTSYLKYPDLRRQYLAVFIVFVSQQMVDEPRTGIRIATDEPHLHRPHQILADIVELGAMPLWHNRPNQVYV